IHIDFVLEQFRSNRQTALYLVGECKRVDSKFGRWCFARAAYTSQKIIFDQFNCEPPYIVTQQTSITDVLRKPYQLGFELRNRNSGANAGETSSGRNGVRPVNWRVFLTG